MVTLEREIIRTEPVPAVSPTETKPEPHPSVFAARVCERFDCRAGKVEFGDTEAASPQSGDWWGFQAGTLHVRICVWRVTQESDSLWNSSTKSFEAQCASNPLLSHVRNVLRDP